MLQKDQDWWKEKIIRNKQANEGKNGNQIYFEKVSKLCKGKYKKVTQEITKRMEKENCNKVFENFNSMSDTTGSFNTLGIWGVKKKIFPSKQKSKIIAKKNEKGKLVTNPIELKKIYLNTFISRLRHRKIKHGFEELEFLKEYLCSSRLKICSMTRSSALTREKISKVLGNLKGNKSRDPH